MRSPHTSAYHYLLTRLAEAREDSGMTQGEVASKLAMPQSRLSRIESGERRLDVVELEEMAKLYCRPLAYFVPKR